MNAAATESEIITLSDADDMPARRMKALADDYSSAPAGIDPAIAAAHERLEKHRRQEWLSALANKTVDKATRETSSRGNALLTWIDGNGVLCARRISLEESTIREHVPGFLRRGARR